MKNFILFIFFLCTTYLEASELHETRAEIFVINYTNDSLFVKFYPVGGLFNGWDHGPIPTKYSLGKYQNYE